MAPGLPLALFGLLRRLCRSGAAEGAADGAGVAVFASADHFLWFIGPAGRSHFLVVQR
jgi:hypothetical protein